jgi:hypothetical protein
MQSERGFSGDEFAPAGGLELQGQAKGIAVELYRSVHIADELDYVGEFP